MGSWIVQIKQKDKIHAMNSIFEIGFLLQEMTDLLDMSLREVSLQNSLKRAKRCALQFSNI